MPIPQAVIEATEKGMVGENLLCSSVPSMERDASQEKEVLTRAEEACKGATSVGERRPGGRRVRIKGVDV